MLAGSSSKGEQREAATCVGKQEREGRSLAGGVRALDVLVVVVILISS